MTEPLISVIILNWNGAQFLKPCFDSLCKQRGPFRLETIIVDNGSTDDSRSVIDAYPLTNKKTLYLKDNLGFAAGNNAGLQIASGDYIFFLNNDTELADESVSALVNAFNKNPEFHIIGASMIRIVDRQTIDTQGDTFTIFGKARKRREGSPYQNHAGLTEIFSVCAGAAMVQRNVLDICGGFDKDFFHTFEDIDLSFRARLAGFRIAVEPRAVVYHHVGATRQIKSDSSLYYEQRNMEYVLIKNLPTPLLAMLILPISFFRTYTLVRFAFKFKLHIFFRAKGDVLKNIAPLLVKRKTIQKARTCTLLSLLRRMTLT